MIKIYHDFPGEVESLWRDLERDPKVLVFQTFVWCESAWRTFAGARKGRSVHIIVWRGDKGETPVLLPTFIDEHGALRFIGDEHSDAGDALYERNVNKHWAFKEIVEYIRGDRDVRSVALQKFRLDSEALQYLSVFMKDALVYRDHTYSWIEFPAGKGFMEGQVHLKAKDRDRIKANERKCSGSLVRVFSSMRRDAFPVERIEKMLDVMKATGARDGHFFDEKIMSFVRRLYDAGACEIVALSKGDIDEAISFQMVKGNRNHCWVFLYSDPQKNTMHRVKYFDEIAASGGIVDFGVGTYDYKMGTFRPALGCTFSLRWGRGLFMKMYAYARMLWRFLRVGLQ